MKVGFKSLNQDPNGAGSDLGDLFIPKNLFTQGGLWLWGRNSTGQLGDNSVTSRSSPIQTLGSGNNWLLCSGGSYTSFGIKTDGTLWAWGRNDTGQLGDDTVVNKSSPVQTISAGSDWKTLSTSSGRHTAAIKTNGQLWLWGINNYGQLGNNSTTNRSSPVQTVSADTNWKQVAAGYIQTAAIKTDGTLWTWGRNNYGQLGDNTVANKSSPVQTVSGGTNWKQVSAGGFHIAAIKTDGTLWTWGAATDGQLGNSSTINRSSPVQTVSAGTNWKQVAAGYTFTAAIKTDGTLWTWGVNDSGQLGNNTVVNRSSPVQTVSAGTNWKLVSSGFYHTAAIKTNGELWLWGRNTSHGQLGDNTVVSKSSPVQTTAAGTNWKLVHSAGYHTLTVREDYY